MRSLEAGVALLLALCVTMGAGSFQLSGEAASTINAMPLLEWLTGAPAGWSWWLWLSLALLGLLAVNTLCCSFDTLRMRWRRAGFVPLAAPQLIHAGFLLILLAHGISAVGSSNISLEVSEGGAARLPDGRMFGVSAISVSYSPSGMPIGFSCELIPEIASPSRRVAISPNHPWFSGGYGVYIKQAEQYPFPRALIEIHREPGAGMALAGALLFTVGGAALLWLKGRAKEPGATGGAS